MRHKNYVLAQSFAAENHLTTSDFIKSLMLFSGDYLVGLRERKNDVFESLEELKIAGRIINVHAKQINSNIENRNHLDDGLYNDLFNIIDRAISAYQTLRFFDNELLMNQLHLEASKNYKYKKQSILRRRTWQFFKLNLSEKEHAEILKKVDHYTIELPKLTVNKFGNICLGVFLNQNAFDDKFTSRSIKELIRQLKYILVNATQIFNDVRENARTIEIKTAQKIRERIRYILDDLKDDPALYSGRKFSYIYYAKRPKLRSTENV